MDLFRPSLRLRGWLHPADRLRPRLARRAGEALHDCGLRAAAVRGGRGVPVRL